MYLMHLCICNSPNNNWRQITNLFQKPSTKFFYVNDSCNNPPSHCTSTCWIFLCIDRSSVAISHNAVTWLGLTGIKEKAVIESSCTSSCWLKCLHFSKFHVFYITNSVPEAERLPGKLFRDYKPQNTNVYSSVKWNILICEVENLSYIFSYLANSMRV